MVKSSARFSMLFNFLLQAMAGVAACSKATLFDMAACCRATLVRINEAVDENFKRPGFRYYTYPTKNI